jgi:hypothetical protein
MRRQWNEGCGGILLGDNTDDERIMLRLILFQCFGVWVSASLSCVHIDCKIWNYTPTCRKLRIYSKLGPKYCVSVYTVMPMNMTARIFVKFYETCRNFTLMLCYVIPRMYSYLMTFWNLCLTIIFLTTPLHVKAYYIKIRRALVSHLKILYLSLYLLTVRNKIL